MPDNSVDSIVTDPPYGLQFMGKKWDYDVPSVEVWRQVFRVLKPGGHMLCACGTRTQHRMVVNVEDAGFHIRDVVSWIYGSGFPKSMNISKSIDKAAGKEREVVGRRKHPTLTDTDNKLSEPANAAHGGNEWAREWDITAPSTPEAEQWEGWGTALKPACEFFTLARKPLGEKTVAANVLKWGTGAINIDGCRVGSELRHNGAASPTSASRKSRVEAGYRNDDGRGPGADGEDVIGRFPANLIHDGSQQVMDLFPDSKGAMGSVKGTEPSRTGDANTVCYGEYKGRRSQEKRGDSGSAARFFYCVKASKKDRNEGLEEPPSQLEHGTTLRNVENADLKGNNHPTVKPTDLMRYLCRLITPPQGIVLDPFMGSGSTGKAALREGFSFIGIELEEKYCEIAANRLSQEVLAL